MEVIMTDILIRGVPEDVLAGDLDDPAVMSDAWS